MKEKMNWYLNLKKNYRLLITLGSWIPVIVYADLTKDSGGVLDSLIFLAFLVLGMFFTVFYFKSIKLENKKNYIPNENNEEYSPYTIRNINNDKQRELYQELIKNDFNVKENLSNFESNLMIATLRQLRAHPMFKVEDIDFDIEHRINELQEHAYKQKIKSKKGSFVAVDIETTGINMNSDRIVQLSAVKVIDFNIVGTFSTYINPKKHIPVSASDIHNITNDMVQDMPTIKDAFPEFEVFIENYKLVMHNSSFDYTILQNEYFRVYKKMFERETVCTMKLWQKRFRELQNEKAPTAKLCHVAAILLTPEQLKDYNSCQHDALVDATATANIYMKMV